MAYQVEKREITVEEAEMLEEVMVSEHLTDWETKFVEDLDGEKYITVDQALKLRQIHEERT